MPEAKQPTTENVVSTDEVLHLLKKGKELHDHFAEQFRKEYKVSGKAVNEWKEYFRIKVPPDVNPEICKNLDVKIMELHQEASFFKAEADARFSALKGASSDKYRAHIASLVAEHKQSGQKVPAAATLASLAEHSIGTLKNAIIHAEIELAFWKEILSDLANSRKLIENCTMNLGIEAKAIQQERYLDKINSQRSY